MTIDAVPLSEVFKGSRARDSVEAAHRAERAKADTSSDAGQLAAIETAATTALSKFREKKAELIKAGQLSPKGLADELVKEANAIKARLDEMLTSVLEPRAERVASFEVTLPDAPDDAAGLLAWFNNLRGIERTRAIVEARSGRDAKLTRALATADPRLVNLIDIDHEAIIRAAMSPEVRDAVTANTDLRSRIEATRETVRQVINTATREATL